MRQEIYLDNAATTRPYAEVRTAVEQTMAMDFGNPSSLHTKGLEAERYVTEAARTAAASLKAEPGEIIFTSGGTESNNMALMGAAFAAKRMGRHIITTQMEHPSVYQPLLFLESLGYEITFLPVNHNGQFSLEELSQAVRPDTVLVSVMMVNNEIGAVTDTAAIAGCIKKQNPNTLFHVDAIQAYGKYRIAPGRMGIDLLSVSGHKIHGPKGAGFLYVKKKTKLKPLLYGGGQQNGMRSGTLNVPGIAGLAAATIKIYENWEEKFAFMYKLKEYFTSQLTLMEGVIVHGMEGLAVKETAPHIVSAGFFGIRSEVLLHALSQEGIYVSSGSACSSHHPMLNGTLQAIGVDADYLEGTLRFSFCPDTTKEELEITLEALRRLLPKLRRFQRK